MKKVLIVVVLSLCFVNLLLSQESPAPSSPPPSAPPASPPSAPPAPSAPAQQPAQNNSNVYQQQVMQQQNNQRFLNLQLVEMYGNNQSLVFEKNRRDIDALYRRTNKKEMKLLEVNENDKQKYNLFLKSDQSGLIKLISDLGCSANTKVVVAKEECLKYSMPGAGSSYSFRVEDYRIPQLADISFFDSIFEATGTLLHGIFAGIGDVPLENVSLQSDGVKYLSEIKPITKYEEALTFSNKMSKGIMNDGFFYGSRIKAVENMTYVLRSIAYEGEIPKAVNGITYNELDFDKRKDVTIAFRIVRRDGDGSVTLLWRELARQKSLKMEQKKREKEKIEDSKNNSTAKN